MQNQTDDLVRRTALFTVLFLFFGCGQSAAQRQGTPEMTASTGTGTGSIMTSGSGAGGACDIHCSPDLREVLDCADKVVKKCPDDKGCSAGECIEPCAAAEANASALGCEFYSAPPRDDYGSTAGSCFAAMVANTWPTPVTISVEYGGMPLDAGIAYTTKGSGANLSYEPLHGGQLGPGQMAIVFLSNGPKPGMSDMYIACPAGVRVGVPKDTAIDTGKGHAFRIKTSVPIAAYDIYPYGGALSYTPSATLLVPISAWGTNYLAADAWPPIKVPGMDDLSGPTLAFVAAEDDTSVTILPTHAIEGGSGVVAAPAGQPATYTLAKGELLQFHQVEELAGSVISSTKRIGVWGGTGRMDIPQGLEAADGGHQQLVPVKALASEYVAVRYRDRVGTSETTPWTIIGAVDGTELTYDPWPPDNSPSKLAQGQVVRMETAEPFVVRSQDDKHPFYLAGHMTGGSAAEPGAKGDLSQVGDPEYVNAVPPPQWLRSYVFLTDPTYRTTNLVFVRQKAKDGAFKDVTLDCAGKVTGWKAVDAKGQYERAYVDLVVHGAPVGSCDNGAHTASSDAVFGLTVWGWDSYASYAYPAGMGTRAINTVVVPPIPK